MPRTKVRTGELGAPGITSSIEGWLDTWETTQELLWPNSILIYEAMRHDAHLEGCLDATTLPIERSTWDLTPESIAECKPEVVQLVREDLGLAVKGTHLRRPRGGVVFGDYLRHALLELPFGHMVFEQVYDLIDGRARLRKLAPRMPRTIIGWDIAPDGGLRAVRQHVPRANGFWDTVDIPVDRLVLFARRQEGSDPTGRSIFRSSFIHWEAKQKLIRLDAMAVERNGMGIPQVTFDGQTVTKAEALDVASKLRSGEAAGVAFEEGTANLEIKGTTGSVREALPSIKYHDQEMSRRMLAMFLDLGQDNGARSLGETFVDFFVMSLQATADHIADVTNEHVIRDLVELNYGPDEPYPLIRCDEITADTDLTAEALKQLADGGYIIPGPELEAFLRKRYKMPTETLAPAAPAVDDPAPIIVDGPSEPAMLSRLQARYDALMAGPRTPATRVPSGQ
jgi:hypothetical protein